MSSTRVRAGLLVILLFVSACGGAPVEEPAASAPADTVQVPPVQLTERLDRLQAESESLRVAVEDLRASLDAPAARAEGGATLGEAGRTLQNLSLRIFWALLVIVLAVYLARVIVFVLEGLADRSAERRLFYKRLVPIARILVWALAIFVVLRVIFALDAAGLAAAAAAVGVAVGFASQDLLKNIFGGLVIIFDQPFQVGDKISVGGTYGEVTSIGLRSTRITTPDDNLVSVPNAQVVDGQVSNANAGALDCQVVTDLYLPGVIDEAAAKRIAYEAAAASSYVYLKKPIVVLIKDEFKETFLTRVRVKAYVLDTRYEFLLQSEITERARMRFREEGLFDAWRTVRPWSGWAGADGPEPAPREDMR